VRRLPLILLLSSSAVIAAPLPTIAVESPPQDAPGVAGVLYLNRCRGGCTFAKGDDDASAHRSSLLVGDGPFAIREFNWTDTDWNALVQCMREVYSPYNLTVVDVKPIDVEYNEAIVAGVPQDIGRSSIVGIAKLADDCSAYRNVVSFVFANAITSHDVNLLCYATAQETGHAFGLDHSYEFGLGSSACLDPMSYRTDCGGQRFFRPWLARCGENFARPCACGPTQNSHEHLLEVLGPGVPITAAPNVEITAPQPDTKMGDRITVRATAPRGVFRYEIWLNGFLWSVQPGAPYSSTGQIDIAYLLLPQGVPDGVTDIVIVAQDDIGVSTTAAVTAVRGEPCTTTEKCLAGQRCDAGRCLWDPPVGEFGDSCTYAQYCKSNVCVDSVCTETCSLESGAACADGYTCVYGYPDDVCRPGEYGGGCSASRGAPTALVGFMMLVAWRRRRSRPSMARSSRARSSTS